MQCLLNQFIEPVVNIVYRYLGFNSVIYRYLGLSQIFVIEFVLIIQQKFIHLAFFYVNWLIPFYVKIKRNLKIRLSMNYTL